MRYLAILTGIGAILILGQTTQGQLEKSKAPQEVQAASKPQLIAKFWSAARQQISYDATFRKREACTSIRKALKFYRARTWNAEDSLGLVRSFSSYPERIPGRCGYLVWRAAKWKQAATRTRKQLERFNSGSHYERAKHIIYAIFPDGTQHRALAVSGCETGHKYTPWSENVSSHTAGLFQIHPGNHGTTWYWNGSSITIDRSKLFDPWYNTKVALHMSKGGENWGQWASVCQR